LINIAALTAKLTDILAARVSFEVRNESNPPFGREATDTATRFSLVFGF
jgi:putative salt-induced outer membrane protein